MVNHKNIAIRRAVGIMHTAWIFVCFLFSMFISLFLIFRSSFSKFLSLNSRDVLLAASLKVDI